MNNQSNLISAAALVVRRNPRYLFWFGLLNLTLAEFGTAAYRNRVHAILDNSLNAEKLYQGFNPAAYVEMMLRPDGGPWLVSAMPAMYFALLFALATAFLMPGVLRQYTSDYRVSKEEFFRSCARNLWRFIRLIIVYGVVALPVTGILFGIRGAIEKATDKSTTEMLTFYVGLVSLIVIFLVVTTVRIWFDLAQVDIVVRDQGAVRKSIAIGFRYSRRFLVRLLVAYVVISVLAFLSLAIGIWLWHVLIPPASLVGAFLISQVILFVCLAMRFWQRAVAAVFYLREMLVQPASPRPTTLEPVASSAPLSPMPAPEGAGG